jgi:hypothetical protein
MEEVLNGYVTYPNPTLTPGPGDEVALTLTPNPNLNPNCNPNRINKKIQKETTSKNR